MKRVSVLLEPARTIDAIVLALLAAMAVGSLLLFRTHERASAILGLLALSSALSGLVSLRLIQALYVNGAVGRRAAKSWVAQHPVVTLVTSLALETIVLSADAQGLARTGNHLVVGLLVLIAFPLGILILHPREVWQLGQPMRQKRKASRAVTMGHWHQFVEWVMGPLDGVRRLYGYVKSRKDLS